MRIFDKHRVRGSFYHMVALIFLVSTALWYFEIVSDKMSYIITAILFVVDYIAEMYDPHPENPGPWYAHFHRIKEDVEEEICELKALFKRNDAEFAELLKKHEK